MVDITSGLPMLGLMGPRSRELLQRLSGEDLSNAAFPFGTSRELEIGYARVRASRITYVGELGWELYVPAEFATHVFDRIVEAGREFGLTHAGYHAMNACRTEKGYRHWGHDIGPEDDPLAAGLGFCVAWDKPGGFIGRDALLPRPRGRHAEPPPGPAPPAGRRQAALPRGAGGGRADRGLGHLGHVRAPGRRAARHGLPAA